MINALNVLLGAINSQTLRSDLELASRITEAQEREDPHKDADRIGLEIFQGSYIHCLGAVLVNKKAILPKSTIFIIYVLVAQPISKVDALDHRGCPFVTRDERDRLEHIFDISMAPILSFNC